MVKKHVLSLIAIFMFVIFLAGCAVPVNNDVKPADILDNSAVDKVSSRGVSWQLVDGSINNARDIAAAGDVFVLSSDGKTIYKLNQSTQKFDVIEDDISFLQNDPGLRIAAGGGWAYGIHGNNGTVLNWFTGLYLVTESKKVYVQHDGRYMPKPEWSYLPGISAEHIGVSNGVTTNYVSGYAYFTSPYTAPRTIVHKFNGYNSSSPNNISWQNYKYIGLPVLAADGATVESPYDYGFLALCGNGDANNGVYKLYVHPYWGPSYSKVTNMAGVIPSTDIAGDPSPDNVNKCFATFQLDTNRVYYIDPVKNSKISLGGCRKISIDSNGALWDAYGSGIWKATF